MTRNGLMAQYCCVHCPICKVQGSIKTLVLKKRVVKIWLSSRQYITLFQGLRSASTHTLWQTRNHIGKWANGVIGGSVCFVYAKLNGFSCTHESLHNIYICKNPFSGSVRMLEYHERNPMHL